MPEKIFPAIRCTTWFSFQLIIEGAVQVLEETKTDNKHIFISEQLKEIRKVTLAEIICKNGDNISQLQPDVFHAVSDK